MKILFIGGSGNISTACTRAAIAKGYEVYHLNRGQTNYHVIEGVKTLIADINDKDQVEKALKNYEFDVVANFIAFKPSDVERDIALFAGKIKQYVFISSASAYQKPLANPVITEGTPLKNPYWDYSRDKIDCENRLMQAYRDIDFPVTIVRPSLTYEYVMPVAIGGWNDYTIVDRMKRGDKIIVHGDGSSLWTITHSEDFAKGFVGLLGHQQAIGESFHITSDEILTWDQIYQAIGEAVGVKPEIVHIASDFICQESEKIDWIWMGGSFQRGNLLGDKAVSAIFDNSKIKSFVPEFKATIPFNVGIKKTIEWFEAEKSRMVVHADYNKFMDTIIEKYQR